MTVSNPASKLTSQAGSTTPEREIGRRSIESSFKCSERTPRHEALADARGGEQDCLFIAGPQAARATSRRIGQSIGPSTRSGRRTADLHRVYRSSWGVVLVGGRAKGRTAGIGWRWGLEGSEGMAGRWGSACAGGREVPDSGWCARPGRVRCPSPGGLPCRGFTPRTVLRG